MFEFIRGWYGKYFSDPQAVVLFLCLAFGLIFLILFGGMLAPVFAGVIIAYVLDWLCVHLENWGLSRKFAFYLVFCLFISFMVLTVVILVPAIWQQTIRLVDELPQMVILAQEFLSHLPEEYPDFINQTQMNTILAEIRLEATSIGRRLVTMSFASIPTLIAIFIYLILVPLMIFFMMKDKSVIKLWSDKYFPSDSGLLKRVWSEVDQQLGNYIRGKLAECIIVAVATYLVFWFFSLQYSVLLAVLVGVSVFIPYVGAAVVTIPVAAVGLFQFGLSAEFAYLLLAYFVVQALDGNVLVPILFSEAVSLHPLAIIIAILFFGGIWGFWGIFFAIPLAVLIKAVLNAWPKPAIENNI